jgi:hypothetical protein
MDCALSFSHFAARDASFNRQSTSESLAESWSKKNAMLGWSMAFEISQF